MKIRKMMNNDGFNEEVNAAVVLCSQSTWLQCSFFKQSWDLVGSYIVESVSSLFKNWRILKAGNATVVSLILKTQVPNTRMRNFHPISSCNVVYKCITKILEGIIKPVLDSIVASLLFLDDMSNTSTKWYTSQHAVQSTNFFLKDAVLVCLTSTVFFVSHIPLARTQMPIQYLGIYNFLVTSRVHVTKKWSLIEYGTCVPIDSKEELIM
ncbi:hypothetical protein LguiA_007501 [Lonicera macranthoides]